jgi:peptidase M50B-like protein
VFLLASDFGFLFSGTCVPKWIKFIIAILLLPVCAGAAMALGRVLRASYGADTVWVPFLAGAACWLVIFLLLPRPMWIYVFGHELTHALWAWLFGGRVKKMKVTSEGGHVVVSKTNFLIVLAPYFFPLYAVLVILVFAIGHWIWDWRGYLVWFHLAVGAAYAFHVTLTWQALKTRQTDITSQGYLFSAVIIFLGNVSVLLFGVPLLTAKVGWLNALGWWLEGTGEIFNRLARWF